MLKTTLGSVLLGRSSFKLIRHRISVEGCVYADTARLGVMKNAQIAGSDVRSRQSQLPKTGCSWHYPGRTVASMIDQSGPSKSTTTIDRINPEMPDPRRGIR